MKRLPEAVRNYLLQFTLEQRCAAYLCADREGRVLRTGGHLDNYDLSSVAPGDDILQAAYFLVGILPPEAGPLLLPRLEVAPSRFADVHVFIVDEEIWVVLLDASAEIAERTQIEQALREAEQRLRQAERMEALGRLAGGIAHDFNNLLTAILGYGQLMFDALGELDTRRAQVVEIRKAADRGAHLVRQLLAFSRRQPTRSSIININDVINDAMGMLTRVVGEDIRFELQLEPRLAPVEADPSQIQQVVLNLAVNARDAMPRGGLFTIETRNLAPKDDRPPGEPDYVLLRVSDTGTGMDEQTRAHIFEPFFTTKGPGQGTGLGLSTVFGIVTQCGGDISVTTAPGVGTTFDIRIPRSAAETAGIPAKRAEGIARAQGETVLLVEDDPVVHGLVRELVARLGYNVLDAGSADEALRVSERHRGLIHLLLTDVVMPDVSGIELAAQLRAKRPAMKTLFMSGYSSDVIQQRGPADVQAPLVEKPFTFEQLSRAIRETIDAGGAIAQPKPAA